MVMLFHAEFQLTQTLNNQKGSEAMNGEYIEGRPCRLDFSTPRDNTNNNNNNNRRGGFGGGFGGRERSATPRSGNSTPRPNKSTEFKGTKKTFD
ncbi:hypothetical protein FOB64_002219 [Candida albicans]|uniref:Uncharacterized protein n=1 Tax=Candida albicans TaxID=5476 RepID=A0A8H6BYE5_CANAX|nr:hypothetical protein FOB64_002219 [Candida albicans]